MPVHIRLFFTLSLACCLLITLLALSSGPAYAEWVAVGGNDEAGLTAYVNPGTLHRNGDLVKMWELYDYKTIPTVEGKSYLSYKVQREYDCAEERMRTHAITYFSGNMGSGKVVFNNSDEGKWRPVPPDSIAEGLGKRACGKQ